MKTLIIIYFAIYLIIISIAWIRHLKHEAKITLMIMSAVLLLTYPFMLVALLVEKLSEILNK